MKKKWLILNGILLAFVLFHSIARDIELTKRMPGDLRNRVVGARLQKAGKSPYFYHWHEGDNLRYVDPSNNLLDSTYQSNVTGSPFLHQLLYPICEYSEWTIAFMLLTMQYVMLLAIIVICCKIAPDPFKQMLVINVGILITLTEAWKSLMYSGQYYFFCAFLIMCIVAAMLQKNKLVYIIAGFAMAVIILIRPIIAVALIPILTIKKPIRPFLISTFSGFTIYFLFVMTSPFEKYLWGDYLRALQKHVEMHQEFDKKNPNKPKNPDVLKLEGFNLVKIDHDCLEKPIPVYSENGNFFVIYYMLTKHKMPLVILNAIAIGLIIILLGLYFYYDRKYGLLTVQTLIFSFSLYMVLELSTPIHRFQYYTLQWLPIVLIGFILSKNWKSLTFILLSLGLLLNILNIPWLLMRHTIGEYCWMIALLIISFYPKENLSWQLQ